jgi:hypothetical protein
MATWTDVSNTVLEPGDPIRSVDIIAIKENVIALSEGASGAPKILTAAINNSAVTTEKLATDERMNTGNVLGATASASAGAVGTYGYLEPLILITASPGSTRAGSGLRWALGGPTTLSGTWRLLGQYSDSESGRLWLRIS